MFKCFSVYFFFYYSNEKDWTAVNCVDSVKWPPGKTADHKCSFPGDQKSYVYRVITVNALGESATKPSASLNVINDGK